MPAIGLEAVVAGRKEDGGFALEEKIVVLVASDDLHEPGGRQAGIEAIAVEGVGADGENGVGGGDAKGRVAFPEVEARGEAVGGGEVDDGGEGRGPQVRPRGGGDEHTEGKNEQAPCGVAHSAIIMWR